ncbi:hypothetical protein RND81_01G226500 [Saponaria officinalis]|uniref:Pseudouridine synthase I TruA alpha/beta domain-containing protein n=1 Tax=Saponaria officinalis TaxID=3572 RepID=A0AAW1NKB0_SAPOF
MDARHQNPPSSDSPPPSKDADGGDEPALKKTKMSSTTTTSDDDTTVKPRRYKRRKVAIFMAYCGVGYQGMQKNPGAKTIEGDLEEALFLAGAVPDDERGQHKRYDWARSARTDKGVSAVGQVISGRFFVDPPGFVVRLNSFLSPQIRIFGYKRATPSFNAKKFCDRRRYVYLLPVFGLDPSCHRDRESVMASLGSDEELVKCVECSERGRKVFGVVGNKRDSTNGILSDSCDLAALEHEKGNVCVENGNGVTGEESSGNVKSEESKEEDQNEEKGEGSKVSNKCEFKYGDEVKERLNTILKYYEGTHNFHNFTTRTKAEDPSAKRYIVSFQANTTLTIEGIQFVKCEVVGQSFMLHQIRKMMGMAVAVIRNFAPQSIYDTAFDRDVNINVPTAPEVGLYLDECFFTSYNNKWQGTHEELSMKSYEEEAQEFKMKNIYSHIAHTEHKEGSVALWLHSLNRRNYPDLCHTQEVVEVVEGVAAA